MDRRIFVRGAILSAAALGLKGLESLLSSGLFSNGKREKTLVITVSYPQGKNIDYYLRHRPKFFDYKKLEVLEKSYQSGTAPALISQNTKYSSEGLRIYYTFTDSKALRHFLYDLYKIRGNVEVRNQYGITFHHAIA